VTERPLRGWLYDRVDRSVESTMKASSRGAKAPPAGRRCRTLSDAPPTIASSFVVLVYGSAGTYFFNTKSPKERATASTPMTRLRMTNPPAASTRAFSHASVAL
jgi:hypothetical protein